MKNRNLIPVENNAGLARDPISNAIINVNTNEIRKAKLRKAEINKRRQKEIETEKKISNLEQQLTDIKHLLTQFLEKSNGSN